MKLRIILDKSVVYGLNSLEVDSLDRFFFQIIPPILTNEIIADLSKEGVKPNAANIISFNTYKISGSRGLTVNYKNLLANSLLGNEIPMDGRFIPLGAKMVYGNDGGIGTVIETAFEDEIIARWERKEFTIREKKFATDWRRRAERYINPKIYTDKISEAGLGFSIPKNDKELAEIVDSLLQEKKLQGKLLVLLAKEHNIPLASQKKVVNRWFKEGKPMIKDFAPYAFFCVRANFLWAIGLTNPSLFSPDENDRKDLEYCYYIPHCQIFASKDRKHRRLIPFLLSPDQSFVDGSELKSDLGRLSDNWKKLNREEQINYHLERGGAPPENEKSVIFQLWKKHDGEVSKPLPLEIGKMKLVDSSLPKDEQVETTLEELAVSIAEKYKNAKRISTEEINEFKDIDEENSLGSVLIRTTKISKERAFKLYPQLREQDLD